MGDYAQLYFTNERAVPRRGELDSSSSPYLLSKYHVPVFWLALFAQADMLVAPDEDTGDTWPYLVAPRGDAVARFVDREQFIASSFPLCEAKWMAQFRSLLEQSRFEYVHLETSQIGAMVCSGPEWQTELSAMLTIFDEPRRSAGWSVFNSRFADAYADSKGKVPWPYCGGSGTDQVMPWESSA